MSRSLAATVLLATLMWGTVMAQTVTVGLFQDPPELDPTLSTATSESQIIRQMFNTLLNFDDGGNLIPELALSWSISDDGLTYTFVLRDDVSFHDGTRLDADAVKFNLDRTRSVEGGAYVETLAGIDAVNVIDPTTIEVVLSAPQGSFITLMADNPSMIVSPAAIEASGADFTNNPVGSGPFMFESRVRQDSIVLVRNDNYWRGAPAVERVVYRPFPDGAIRLANLLSGSVDIIYPIEPRDFVSNRDNADLRMIESATNGWRILVLNTRKPPFDNVLVRRALRAAIETSAVSQVVFNGLEPPIGGPISPASAFYTDASAPQPADLELARELLAEAGLSSVEFALTTIARSPEDQQTQLIQAMASPVGIDIEIQPVEVGEYLRRNTGSEFDATTMQWSGLVDPDDNITSFFVTDGFWNWSGYSNPAVDALLEQAKVTSDVAARSELYGEAITLINEDAPVIWLTNQRRLVATTSAIDGVRLLPNTGTLVLENVTKAE